MNASPDHRDSRPAYFAVGLLLLCLNLAPRAQAAVPGMPIMSARSVSGQFVVMASPQVSLLAGDPLFLTNADYVRLDPPLLAVSAERIKKSVYQQFDIDTIKPWRGQIFLGIHAARSPDEEVTIVSSRFDNNWSYRVELPDVVSRERLTRALVGVTLLEFANRRSNDRLAEVPAWLTDGLAEQLLAVNSTAFILSAPSTVEHNVTVRRIEASQRGWDALVEAHHVLQNNTALTFEQMSWPTEDQLSGSDGGVYRASAQLLLNELCALKNGPVRVRSMLETLPDFYNWQIAFRHAFAADFPQPVDVEKWWAVRTVVFAALDIGPMWTPIASRQKLDEILSVPVEYRAESNNLPSHAEVSLQMVIRNFPADRRVEVLRAKAYDLQLAELRMSAQFVGLTERYRQTLAQYLGDAPPPRIVLGGRNTVRSSKINSAEALRRLDELDVERRNAEETLEHLTFPTQMPALTGAKSNL